MSQALIDLEISHKEFETIVNEKKGIKKRNKIVEIYKVMMKIPSK